MAKLFYGSLCFTDILNKAKEGHKAFTKAKNGKIYFSIEEWLNDTPDEYGNVLSVRISEKEKADKHTYIGNLKLSEPKEPEPLNSNDLADMPDEDDLPF